MYLACVNSKNDAKVEPSPIANLNWPMALSRNKIVITALAKLPNNQARQEFAHNEKSFLVPSINGQLCPTF
jgi:hypothetical protein